MSTNLPTEMDDARAITSTTRVNVAFMQTLDQQIQAMAREIVEVRNRSYSIAWAKIDPDGAAIAPGYAVAIKSTNGPDRTPLLVLATGANILAGAQYVGLLVAQGAPGALGKIAVAGVVSVAEATGISGTGTYVVIEPTTALLVRQAGAPSGAQTFVGRCNSDGSVVLNPATGTVAGASGVDAYTTTTAGFTMPAVSATVVVPVAESRWMAIGQVVYVQSAGYFWVTAKPTTTSVTLQNIGVSANAAPTTAIATARAVSAAGEPGAVGTGTASSASMTYSYLVSLGNYTADTTYRTVTNWTAGASAVGISSTPASGTFTISTTGRYRIVFSGAIGYSGTDLANVIEAQLVRNGVLIPEAQRRFIQKEPLCIETVIDLVAGDIIALQVGAGSVETIRLETGEMSVEKLDRTGATGQGAYTTTTAAFTMPAVSATVVVPVTSSVWLTIGQIVYVQSAGYMRVSAVPTTTSVTLTNEGAAGNAAPAAVIATTRTVSAAGEPGALTGAAGGVLAGTYPSPTFAANPNYTTGTGYVGVGATVATVGSFRAAANSVILAARDADPKIVYLLSGAAGNRFWLGGNNASGNYVGTPDEIEVAAGRVLFSIASNALGGSPFVAVSGAAGGAFGAGYLELLNGAYLKLATSGVVASLGDIRAANNVTIIAAKAAGAGDLPLLATNANDRALVEGFVPAHNRKTITATATIDVTEARVIGETIAANKLRVGDQIVVRYAGVETNTTAASTATFRVRIGPTTLTGAIVASNTYTMGTSARTNIPFTGSAIVTILSIGASGTALGQVTMNIDMHSGGTVMPASGGGLTAAVTINTTVANEVELTLVSSVATTTWGIHAGYLEHRRVA